MKANEKIGSSSTVMLAATVLPVANTLSPYLQAVLTAKTGHKTAVQENTNAHALERIFKSRQKS